MPTAVSRGVVTTALQQVTDERMKTYSEYWLVKPSQLEGTKAPDLYAAIKRGEPPQFSFDDVESVKKLLREVSSHTFQPVCDEAGGNLSNLKRWGYFWEHVLLPIVGPAIKLMPSTCLTHKHHRSKNSIEKAQATYR